MFSRMCASLGFKPRDCSRLLARGPPAGEKGCRWIADRCHKRKLLRSSCEPDERVLAVKLSIVIPVYNEERHVLDVLRRVAAVPLDKELVVVNDASGDG